VRKLVTRTGLGLATVLAAVSACVSSSQRNNPGALPTPRVGDVSPRLNASTYVAHGHLLERQGHFEQAVAQYREALKLTPGLVAARNRLGITLNKLGRHPEASAEFRAALEYEPRAAYLHNNLGFSLYLQGEYEAAEQALARAVELEPTFRRAHMNRGLVLARLGRYQDALAAFSLAGPQEEAYFNLAVVQTQTGHYADAARSLEQALAVNPQFDAARQQLREIARLAATEEAERVVAASEQQRADEDAQAARVAGGGSKAAEQASREEQLAETLTDAGAQQSGHQVPERDTEPHSIAGAPPAPSEAVRAGAWRQINYLLAAAEELATPPRLAPRLSRAELAVLFDDLVAAIMQDGPWLEPCLERLRYALRVGDQTH